MLPVGRTFFKDHELWVATSISQPMHSLQEYYYVSLTLIKDKWRFYQNPIKVFPQLFELDARGFPSKNTDLNVWNYWLTVKDQQMPLIKMHKSQIEELVKLLNDS